MGSGKARPVCHRADGKSRGAGARALDAPGGRRRQSPPHASRDDMADDTGAGKSNLSGRLRRVVLGAPRDFRDPHIFHNISLVAFLAWVGLGADGLSSSAYGPDESFRALTEHGD